MIPSSSSPAERWKRRIACSSRPSAVAGGGPLRKPGLPRRSPTVAITIGVIPVAGSVGRRSTFLQTTHAERSSSWSTGTRRSSPAGAARGAVSRWGRREIPFPPAPPRRAVFQLADGRAPLLAGRRREGGRFPVEPAQEVRLLRAALLDAGEGGPGHRAEGPAAGTR